MSEQISFLWECGKCGTDHAEEIMFCPVCAATEGADNKKTVAAADKSGKINEAMMGAIGWSLQHAQIKSGDVLAQAVPRGYRASKIESLRNVPLNVLDDMAGGYVGANRLGATGSGLATGLPGGLAGFAAIPADISAVIYFALRTLSGISQAYSFETASPTGQAVQLLVFAHACKLERVKIGQRQLENFTLAHYLLKNPEPYGQLAKACILKQVAAYLTNDFAKTSWATFLPVVGSVVNGTTNFKFVSDIGKGGKIFYRSLLLALVPNIVQKVVVPVAAPPVVTIELRELSLELPGGKLRLWLAYPQQNTSGPLVVVAWAGNTGRENAEKLAGKGFAALWCGENGNPAYLKEILNYLVTNTLVGPNINLDKIGLVAFGHEANAALELLADAPSTLAKVVVYNPVGPAREIVTNVPLLLQWSSQATADIAVDIEIDRSWAEKIRPARHTTFVTAMEYAGIGFDFVNPVSPDYNPKIARLAWNETLSWLQDLRA